jgi:hypothetical protein
VTLSVFNIENDPPPPNQLWNYSQCFWGFTAIFPEDFEIQRKRGYCGSAWALLLRFAEPWDFSRTCDWPILIETVS